jgi:hypothetical protein
MLQSGRRRPVAIAVRNVFGRRRWSKLGVVEHHAPVAVGKFRNFRDEYFRHFTSISWPYWQRIIGVP